MKKRAARSTQFGMRMTVAEKARLDQLARRYEMSAAQVIRMLIKRESLKGPT